MINFIPDQVNFLYIQNLSIMVMLIKFCEYLSFNPTRKSFNQVSALFLSSIIIAVVSSPKMAQNSLNLFLIFSFCQLAWMVYHEFQRIISIQSIIIIFTITPMSIFHEVMVLSQNSIFIDLFIKIIMIGLSLNLLYQIFIKKQTETENLIVHSMINFSLLIVLTKLISSFCFYDDNIYYNIDYCLQQTFIYTYIVFISNKEITYKISKNEIINESQPINIYSSENFITCTVHEIRSPLSTVKLGLDLLIDELTAKKSETNIQLKDQTNNSDNKIAPDYSDIIDILVNLKISNDIALNCLNDLLTYNKLNSHHKKIDLIIKSENVWDFITKCLKPFAIQVSMNQIDFTSIYVFYSFNFYEYFRQELQILN